MKYRFISCVSLLLVILIGVGTIPIGASSTVTEKSKVSQELQLKLGDMAESDTVEVAVWLNNIDENTLESRYRTNLEKLISRGIIETDYDSAVEIFNADADLKSGSLPFNKVQRLLSVRRSSFCDAITQSNLLWQDDVMSELSDSVNIIYSSTSAPVMIMEVTKADVTKLEHFDAVEGIYCHSSEIEAIDCLSDDNFGIEEVAANNSNYGVWQDITGITEMHEDLYLGYGIRIGLYDQGSPDVNHTSGVFEYSDLEQAYYDSTNKHATYTASIIVGNSNDYFGVAPLSTLVYAGFINGYLSDIDKLVDCDINILCIPFFVLNGTYNSYGIYAKYIDYISCIYNLTVCISAGNSSSSNESVADVAMAYNAITVGNIDDKNTTSKTDDIVKNTCFVDNYTSAYKPDICAPGARVATASSPGMLTGGNGGTSASAPVVAGICALLMEAEPSLIVRPELLKSILMSSAERLPNMEEKYSTSSSIYPALVKEAGAGMVNVIRAMALINSNNFRIVEAASELASDEPYTMSLGVKQSDVNSKDIAICLTWRYKIDVNGNECEATKYSLSLNAPSGERVAYSYYQKDNKQFIYFRPTVAGTYQIVVDKQLVTAHKTPIAFSYSKI